jgi:hypothetical protein
MHNTVNSSSRLPVSAYTQAIVRPIHYTGLTKKKKNPNHSPYINLGKRSHSLYINAIKLVKNNVKLDEETIVY